jgi:hypothetical protein
MHVVHTRSIYVFHLTLTIYIYIIFILYCTQRLIFLIITVFSVRFVGPKQKIFETVYLKKCNNKAYRALIQDTRVFVIAVH